MMLFWPLKKKRRTKRKKKEEKRRENERIKAGEGRKRAENKKKEEPPVLGDCWMGGLEHDVLPFLTIERYVGWITGFWIWFKTDKKYIVCSNWKKLFSVFSCSLSISFFHFLLSLLPYLAFLCSNWKEKERKVRKRIIFLLSFFIYFRFLSSSFYFFPFRFSFFFLSRKNLHFLFLFFLVFINCISVFFFSPFFLFSYSKPSF